MHFSAKFISVAVLCTLAGCSSLNPFSSKSDAKNAPAVLSEIKPTLTTRQIWSVPVGAAGNYVFSPALSGQKIFAAARDGTLVKLDSATGKTEWKINAGMSLTAGVGAGIDTVVVAGEKGALLAFDLDGKLRWKIQQSSEILSAPVVGSGLVIVRSIDNRISAYDVDSGTRKWFLDRTLPALILRSVPGLAIVDNQVIVALPGGRLIALALSNGSLRWEAVLGEPKGATELERVADVSGSPMVIGKDVCASSYQGRVGCFDVNTGSVRWLKSLSSEVGVGVDERFVFAIDSASSVVSYTRDAGASSWKNDKLSYRQLSAPISFGHSVVVGDLAGFVHFLSREDGSFIGRLATDGSPIVTQPLVAGDNLIIQTKSGSVVAIATQ
jgi:outer membrane protein assembly factor BamB